MLIEIPEMYFFCCNDCDTTISMWKEKVSSQIAMCVNKSMLEGSDV